MLLTQPDQARPASYQHKQVLQMQQCIVVAESLVHRGAHAVIQRRSFHSHKSVSGRLLPTTLKCSGIAQNTKLKHSYMFICSFQHVLLRKKGANEPLAVNEMVIHEDRLYLYTRA